VEAGLAFDAALSQVARNTEGPLAEEFFRVLQEMQIGMGRTDAMRALGERTDVEELRSFVTAMVQADAFGIPIANVLRVQAKEMRIKRSQRAEEAAQKVPVKILFPLIFCILPSLFIIVLGPAAITIYDSLISR
jgi:tight adherence protein C